MICELLGAVECLAICIINLAAAAIGPGEMMLALWAAGIGGMAVASTVKITFLLSVRNAAVVNDNRPP